MSSRAPCCRRTPQGATPNQEPTTRRRWQLQIHAQYVKDLSFESPNGPFGAADGQGGVDISVDVRANAKAENHYEVDLILQATGKSAQGTLFVAELTYSGLFTLPDLPMEHRKAVLLIECPRLLFPFGRAIIST